MDGNLLEISWQFFSTSAASALDEHLREHYGACGRELITLAAGKSAARKSAAERKLAAAAKAPQMPTPQAYPAAAEVFRAIAAAPTPRVLVLGQDPYHDGCACGLAFASRGKIAPSLRTIAREIALEREHFGAYALGAPASDRADRCETTDCREIADRREAADCHQTAAKSPVAPLPNEAAKRYAAGICAPQLGEEFFAATARDGVLWLNAALSVAPGRPGSHAAVWAEFSRYLLARAKPDVAMLWGAHAQRGGEQLGAQIVRLAAAHPSPLARGKFYGCAHFALANKILRKRARAPINWLI